MLLTLCVVFSPMRGPRATVTIVSLHDALPISSRKEGVRMGQGTRGEGRTVQVRCVRGHSPRSLPCPRFSSSRRLRSEEHTSELQSPCNLVCRLLLEI